MLALLHSRARALKRHLPTAVAGDADGVHQARVASRRLREVVPVLATGLKSGKADKAGRKIRRLTRALGKVRELDVTMHLLDGLARSEDVPRVAVEEVRAHVIAERDRRREVMLRRLERVNANKLDRRLTSVADALQESDDERWRHALGVRLVKRAKRLLAAIDDAGQVYAAEGLHQVRISGKKLRYVLEIAADSGLKSAEAPLRTIKSAQELLGQIHDLQILQSHVAAVQARPSGRRILPAGLEAISRHIEDQCRHLHGRYVAASPALRDVCADVVKSVAPQLERAGRRPALKMGLARAPQRRAASRGHR